MNYENCVLCSPGFAALLGKDKMMCMPENETVKNCLYVDTSNEKKCSTCDLNFYWSNGKCVRSKIYEPILFYSL